MNPEETTSHQAVIDHAISSRRSVRAFLDQPVSRETVEAILHVARRAPSGTNTQPWQVHVLSGQVLTELCDRIQAAFDDPDSAAHHQAEIPYYPDQWDQPYLDRRRKVGWDLYGLLGITRQDKAGMHRQHGHNYRFFDAPVGMIFTIDGRLRIGSWLDYGMFLQAIMVAARGHGLHTCAQAAFTPFHRIIRQVLDIDETHRIVCGMALGHLDPDAVENTLVTERAAVHEFATFRGF